jgi:hypothetical protein
MVEMKDEEETCMLLQQQQQQHSSSTAAAAEQQQHGEHLLSVSHCNTSHLTPSAAVVVVLQLLCASATANASRLLS